MLFLLGAVVFEACPVGAFSAAGYGLAVCAGYLRSAPSSDCIGFGCRARRACPAGAEHAYGPDEANFLMRAFLSARDAG